MNDTNHDPDIKIIIDSIKDIIPFVNDKFIKNSDGTYYFRYENDDGTMHLLFRPKNGEKNGRR